jgi:hypothetical protein
MNSLVSDLAPAIGGIFAGVVGLFFVWLAVREAHSGERKAAKAEREGQRRAREA